VFRKEWRFESSSGHHQPRKGLTQQEFQRNHVLSLPECYTRVSHMALAMTRPTKHPKTGIYWLRRRVPKDLVALVGRQEVTKTLHTRDPTEAKQRLVQALAELDAQWAYC
jgi:hypothetical protein